MCVQSFFSFVLLQCRRHRTDFRKLLANWTCNSDVTVSHVAMPIKNFPQDLHYVLLKLHVVLTVLGFLSFLGHMYGLVPTRFILPGIPCILNYLFHRVFTAGKEDQTFIKKTIWNGHWVF